MRTLSRTLTRILCAVFAAAFFAHPALASYGTESAAGMSMSTGVETAAPAGFASFCMRHMDDCMRPAQGRVLVALTDEKRQELSAVQAKINGSVRPMEDPTHVWDYPVDGTGDCNKFALAKRRELIAMGWPPEALLLTAAMTEHGEGHLVLVVTTTAGDLVLDNRLSEVIDWRKLPYRWIEQQSPSRLTAWVSIVQNGSRAG